MNGNSFGYEYDGNGMRFKKTVNGKPTEYYYNGTELLAENRNGERIYYIYGVTGIEGIEIADTCYYFDKTHWGDIVAIRIRSGAVVAKYEYDAWGNVTVTDAEGKEETSAGFIGNKNPIRYRGYYYDMETGFYYLQTRYYDPEICRFINADDYEIVPMLSVIPGMLNFYTYCNNNPIMYTDPTGEFLDVILDALFIALYIYNLLKDDGYKDWTNWVALGADVAFAVLPFVSGGGQVIKVADATSDLVDMKRVTIVGETMNRVKETTFNLGRHDKLYGGFQSYQKLAALGRGGKVLAEVGGKASNIAWLYGKVRSGYKVVDIGIDISRTVRSSSYITERIFLGIWRTRNVWKCAYHI